MNPANKQRPNRCFIINEHSSVLFLLLGHFVFGFFFQGSVFINQANVTKSDDLSVNGIIHEIDRILYPPDVDKDSFMLAPVSIHQVILE